MTDLDVIREVVAEVHHRVSVGMSMAHSDRLKYKLVIDALDKQIPKKPSWVDSVPHSRCPACHNAVATYIDSPKLPYCYWCGQALDWGESE